MGIKTSSASRSIFFVLKNMLAAAVIVAVLLVVLFFWLRSYTEHGVEVVVPDVVGLYMEEASAQMQAVGLSIEVSDSTYSDKVPMGTIVEQVPLSDGHVKRGRTIYAIINANSRRQIPLPDLHDLSYRQAEATLRSIGIRVNERYEYEPSEYKDLVLDVKLGGRSLAPGERIDEGSEVTLVVGFGRGTEMVLVPSVLGMSLQDARSLLLNRRLTVGAIEYDMPLSEDMGDREPVVYMQEPTIGASIMEGSMINLKLSSDVEKAVMMNNEEGEDDFF